MASAPRRPEESQSGRRPRSTLKFKVGLYLTLALSAATLAFVFIMAWYQRAELLRQEADHVDQVAALIAKSTRFAMLQNHPYYVDRIIRDVSGQGGPARVRVIDKDGQIIRPSKNGEVGSTIDRETEGCAQCQRLLDFARDKRPEKTYADINAIIKDTVRIVERPAHLKQIDIRLDLERSLPPIKQVMMNMLVNAQQAIEGHGAITIRSRRLAEPRSPEPGTPAVSMIEVAISDTGSGIPERNLLRIFDPFFTTKEVGKGTGLGLSVSHGIVKAHGGAIEVDSRVGEGTTFHICLPIDPPTEATDGPNGGSGLHEL